MNRIAAKAFAFAFLAIASLGSNLAFATQTNNPVQGGRAVTIEGIGLLLGNNAVGLTEGSLHLAAFVGIVLLVTSLIKIRQARMYGETIGGFVAMAFVGAMLFSVTTLISIVNTSAFGVDESLLQQELLLIR